MCITARSVTKDRADEAYPKQFRPRLAGTKENKGEFVLLHKGINATLLCIYAWQVKRLRVCTGNQEYNK
jgi:hypothetical protein